jgi:hypothetical protein
MDRFGKWGLRTAATIIAAFAINTCIQLYEQSTDVERKHAWAMVEFVGKIAGIGSICFCVGLLAALALWTRRADKLDTATRKEIHHATED